MPAGPRVLVAILTFRRPQELSAVLPAVVRQVESVAGEAGAVLVVDNDPAAGARSFVEGYPSARVRYVHEPRAGIATARNQAVDAASDYEALVFIDDDELPGEGWLSALVDHWALGGAAAVAGPVISKVPDDADPWLVAGRFFERRRRLTGTCLAGAATNNLLLDMAQLRASGLRFDSAFDLTGGEDTMLSHSLVAKGLVIRWCDEALVHEVVPVSRLSRRWVLRRAFRTGNSWSRVAIALAPGRTRGLLARAELTARGTKIALAGIVGVGLGVVRGDLPRRAGGAGGIASGLGVLAGAAGYVHVEYRRPW